MSCAHARGIPTRLNRSSLTDFERFGDQNYSREELVAEMGAAFLCGICWHREQNHQQQCGISGELARRTEERLSHGFGRSQSSPKGSRLILGVTPTDAAQQNVG